MHRLSPIFAFGYHGCDKTVAERLLSGEDFKPSQNDYDWLGPGIYFWEANPRRGYEYAEELSKVKRRPTIRSPTVIGAVIELGLCLDLTTSTGIQQVRDAHKHLGEISERAGWTLPKNSKDLLQRNLDCAVIRLLHEIRMEADEPPIDTVKGIFVEGDEIYPGSGFYDKTHVQICVSNPESIKAVFRVHPRYLA